MIGKACTKQAPRHDNSVTCIPKFPQLRQRAFRIFNVFLKVGSILKLTCCACDYSQLCKNHNWIEISSEYFFSHRTLLISKHFKLLCSLKHSKSTILFSKYLSAIAVTKLVMKIIFTTNYLEYLSELNIVSCEPESLGYLDQTLC